MTSRHSTRIALMGGAAIAALTVGVATPGLAQTAPTPATGSTDAQSAAPAKPADKSDEIVVTGIRRGIQSAIFAKKEDTSIIEAVSAEDIGKLPDTSIAESIARLPGIAAQRTNGRAQTLSIRGLGPDYTVTTFNGREQASTNDNRTVEFDQYPSELVSQVKVYKTPDAGMPYQGIAGTADIETVHPLAFGHRAVALNYRYEKDDLKTPIPGSTTSGDRESVTYIDQFLDKTLGVALGIAHTKSPYQAQTYESWGYATGPGGLIVNGGEKDGEQTSYYERTGYLGVVEWKPNDKIHSTIDAYHSDFKEAQTLRRLEYGTQWGSGTLQPGYTTQNGRIVSGTYTGVTTIVENYYNQRDAHVDSLGWNTTYHPADGWTLDSDLSWSKVRRVDLRLESTAGTGPNGSVVTDTLTFRTLPDGRTLNFTGLNYGDFTKVFLTDPGGWGGGPSRSGFVGNPSIHDEIKAIKLAATRDVNRWGISSITAGVNYADRTKSKYEWQSILYLPAASVPAAVVPAAYRQGVMNSNFFGNPNGIISYDAYGLYKSGFWRTVDSRVDSNAGQGDRVFDVTQTWNMEEKLTTPYIKADLRSSLFNIPFTGNVGVQYQYADQQSTQGYTDGNPNPVTKAIDISTVTDGAKYGDVLPSLNLNFDLGNDYHLRVAAAKTVARPRMDDMAGGSSYSVATNTSPITSFGAVTYWSSGGGGNAHLHPWKADAFDLSIEKYFGRKGYVSLAVYYKNLTSYIFNKTQLVSFAGVLLPGQNTASDPVPANYTLANANRMGFSTVKANGHGGRVDGVELTASIPGEVIHPMLDGFGVISSASWNSSAVKPTGTKIELPGLSPMVVNTTVYYEKRGFSVRVSDRYRDRWLGEVPNFDSSLGAHYVKSEEIIDAQIGYEFQEGHLKGLSFNFSGTNLNNAPFVLYDNKSDPTRVLKYEKYGAVYTLSVGYKF